MSGTNDSGDAQNTNDPLAGMNAAQAFNYGTGAGMTLGRAKFDSGGTSFGGQRDLFETLGYPKDEELGFQDFYRRYKRQDIAERIVDAPAMKTWSEAPEVREEADESGDDDDLTEFEDDVETLFEDHELLEALSDTDRLAGIGKYGVLVFGFDDGGELSQPVNRGALNGTDDLNYLTPRHEGHVKQVELDDDPTSERFGKPERYQIDFTQGEGIRTVGTKKALEWVHHERVHPFAEDTLESELVGKERLRSCYNRLCDIEKVVGAASEAAWRSADRGLALLADKDAAANLSDKQMQNMEQESMAWYHDLQPFMRFSGMDDVQVLGGEITDPSGLFDVLTSLIAADVKMPKRVLLGSERGELASTQDRAAWLGRISDRQNQYAGPKILRPILDMFADYGIVSTFGDDGYTVEFRDLFELNEVEKAEVRAKNAKAFKDSFTALSTTQDVTAGEVRQELFDWGVKPGSETGEQPPSEPPEQADVPGPDDVPSDRVPDDGSGDGAEADRPDEPPGVTDVQNMAVTDGGRDQPTGVFAKIRAKVRNR